VALDNDAPLPTPPSLPPDGAPPSGGSSTPGDGNGPDSSPANPSDGLDAGNLGNLSRDPETCTILAPPCENGQWIVMTLDASGNPIPETERRYASTFGSGLGAATNYDINNKYVEFRCFDGEGGSSNSLKGPDTCTPTNPPAPFDPSDYPGGWRATVYCGGGATSDIGGNPFGPFYFASTNPDVILLNNSVRSTGTIDAPWAINYTQTTGVMQLGYENTSTGATFSTITFFLSGGGSTPFLSGSIRFYDTMQDYIDDVPAARWDGADYP
jgi:hypothetical protein